MVDGGGDVRGSRVVMFVVSARLLGVVRLDRGLSGPVSLICFYHGVVLCWQRLASSPGLG